MTSSIVISSGHGKYVRGASGYLDEVDEARRVVDAVAGYLRQMSVTVKTFHDNTSTSQNENLSTIVAYHNAQSRELDVSVHFNAYTTTNSPMGTECLYVTQQSLADKVAAAVAGAGGLIDRGPKKRTDLYFLNNTHEPAILIETCFVDSRADHDLYNENFDEICRAIAETISGRRLGDQPPVEPPIEPPVEPPTEPPTEQPPPSTATGTVYGLVPNDFLNIRAAASSSSPIIGRAENNDVVTVVGQAWNSGTQWLKLKWGDDHMAGVAVYGYASAQYIAVEGEIPGGAPGALDEYDRQQIMSIANHSDIAHYSWRDRGEAPKGYTQGMALEFAQAYLKWKAGHPAVLEMAVGRKGSDKDALHIYRNEFNNLNMGNEQDGIDTLRHLYALMLGHGMRESSGQYCEGRDQSASNVQSDTAEAGLFQTSYNAHSASAPHFDNLMVEYSSPANEPTCYLEAFKENVSCSSSDWDNYGSGAGRDFQALCKECPAFAVESCALTLRNSCDHYGPIVRKETELKAAADEMFQEVQDYIDNRGAA